jgi:hypothetical protein
MVREVKFFGRNGKAGRFERAGSASRTGVCGTDGRLGKARKAERTGTSGTGGISDC